MSPTRRARFALITGVALAVAALTASGLASAAPAPTAARSAVVVPDFGPNVLVFDPSMSTSDIQSAVDAVAAQQVGNQFGDQRYSLLFEPGVYGSVADPLIFDVGYYTEVAGLGRSPRDVTINGAVDVSNQCETLDDGTQSCTALNNFWRSLSNLTINLTGSDCKGSAEFWAVSQASPMRRVAVNGNVSLQDYCTAGPQYASGGYIADSSFSGGTVINGSQQQFFTRNTDLDGWSNGVWNQVFAGDTGAPAQSFPDPTYTTLGHDPVSREKPFLYVTAHGDWRVFVPAAQHNSRGTSWQNGDTAGTSLALSRFYLANPSDSVADINAALGRGLNLIFTPGVYDIGQTIHVNRANTVVLGMGIATLTAQNGAVPMTIADVSGVDVSGLMFDAGATNSSTLLRVGSASPGSTISHANPTSIQDVFFRIGGPHAGRATTSLTVNSNDVLLDDIWAWRADHGTGVGWTENTARTGVVVNGNDVTATGLFVEHYQGYDVVWNGERGQTVFFQNEMPYDPPNQAAWQHGDTLGYAAYKVADKVKVHTGWGLGSYIFTNVDPSLHASHAFEVPQRPGVVLNDILTVSLNEAGTIDHVVNDVGDPVTPDFAGPSFVTRYPAAAAG